MDLGPAKGDEPRAGSQVYGGGDRLRETKGSGNHGTGPVCCGPSGAGSFSWRVTPKPHTPGKRGVGEDAPKTLVLSFSIFLGKINSTDTYSDILEADFPSPWSILAKSDTKLHSRIVRYDQSRESPASSRNSLRGG